MKSEKKFKWSPELSYITGLITADGNLSIDKRHIVIVSKDIQLLKILKRILNLKNKISPRKSSYTGKKDCYHIQFSKVKLYKWFLKVGLIPNKTKKIKKLKIPDKYFFDFLRGYFDGDGTCYSYWDKRWKNSFMFYIAFYSANKSFIMWIQKRINRFLKIKGCCSKSNQGIYKLSYAKRESKEIFPKIYYKKNLPYLERKYKKLQNILEIEKEENRKRFFKNERVLELVDSLD
jgi:hypothetical protein